MNKQAAYIAATHRASTTRSSAHSVTAATLMACLLALPLSGAAALGPATVARQWCEKHTLHYLQKRGYQPYNWTATTYIEGDDYVTKGTWRVDVDELAVECVSKKNSRKGTGSYKILGIDVTETRPGARKPAER